MCGDHKPRVISETGGRYVHVLVSDSKSCKANPRHKSPHLRPSLLWRHLLDCIVSVDDAQHVKQLPLVFVNALDLDVEKGGGGYLHTCG